MLEKYPGIQFEVMTFLGDRIGETITGETAPVVINVFGDDLDVIDAKAAEVAQVLGTVKGAKDVQVKSPPGAPQDGRAVEAGPDDTIWLSAGGNAGGHRNRLSRDSGRAGS